MNRYKKTLYVIIFFISFYAVDAQQQSSSIRGKVIEESSLLPLEYATVSAWSEKSQKEIAVTVTNERGEYLLQGLPCNEELYVRCRYLGIVSKGEKVRSSSVSGGVVLRDILFQDSRRLSTVVVTAKAGNRETSSIKIGRAAIDHLQPNSFSDLIALLPGGKSAAPQMDRFNPLLLRETGSLSTSGAQTYNPNYSITSLGVSFVVDGAPIVTDGNLQYKPSGTSSVWESQRNSINRGVDMRTLSTDNIEQVEFITGIPSVEFGNLTSGVVLVTRKSRVVSPSARFKADGYSKLGYIEGGVVLNRGSSNGQQHINADLGLIDSRIDPRNLLVGYKRINTSLRYYGEEHHWKWHVIGDYTGSFDNAKRDPDLSYGKTDEYYSSYNRCALTGMGQFLSPDVEDSGWKEFKIRCSASQQIELLRERKLMAPDRASLAPSSYESGEHDASLLLGEYVADYACYGRPFSVDFSTTASYRLKFEGCVHDFKGGAEYSFVKNWGKGQVYDLRRPIFIGRWDTRPRDYRTIPALQTLSFFAEDFFSVPINDKNSLELRAGVRSTSLPGLDKKYLIAGKVYLDPRANLQWKSRSLRVGKEQFLVSCGVGYGTTHRMPTLNYLFPDTRYIDILQLNYYDVYHPEMYSRFNVITYVRDVSSYNLKPTLNHKVDAHIRVNWGDGFSIGVTGFFEKMTTGFRYNPEPEAYSFKKYDHSSVDGSSLTAPPDLSAIPYTREKKLEIKSLPQNGTLVVKRGIEFSFSSPRIAALRTAITINGAYYHSSYSNSMALFVPVSAVIDNKAVGDLYVGLYNRDEGSHNKRLNTNIILDTQIPHYGLIFSTTVECVWFTAMRRMPMEGTPFAYFAAEDGKLHNYTSESEQNVYLKQLKESFNSALFREVYVPGGVNVNLKLTKMVGKHLRMSIFAHNLWDYTPDYKANNIIVRRNVFPYFGMEVQLRY